MLIYACLLTTWATLVIRVVEMVGWKLIKSTGMWRFCLLGELASAMEHASSYSAERYMLDRCVLSDAP